MGRLIKLLFVLLYYIIYLFLLFIIAIGPLMFFTDTLDVYKLGAPRYVFPLGLIGFMGFLLFLSMQIESLRWIYKKIPVLLPLLQIGFISLVVTDVGLFFADLWADKMAYSKTIGVTLTILSILIGRAFLSYWYFKHPISYRAFKEKEGGL